MKSISTLVTLACAVALAPARLPAQTAPPAPASRTIVRTIPQKNDYTAEPSLYERYDRVYTYAADGTGSRIITGVVRVQTEAAVKQLSVLSFAFASASEHVVLDYVRVVHPDNSVVTTPAADIQEQPAPVTREAPFYSDLKEEQVPVRSLAPGDRLEYQAHFIRTKAEAPGHFWGTEDLITPLTGAVALEESVEIHLPASSYIEVWSPNFTPTTTDANGERVYRWTSSQLLPVAGKDRKALLKLEAHPDFSGEDALPDIAWTNFHTWKEVGEWYRSLEGSRTEPTDDIKAKVAQLIEGKSTPEEKARAIYGFVGPQIRYIGVAFGIGRYQPHEAADILSNQYGDCKDKTTLLISMLAAAGITADAALIGSGIAFNEAVPSPAAFNHAINLAHIGSQPVWLDSTAEIAPYRLLVSTLRGKRALVIPLTGDPHLETTPKDPPFPFQETFTAIGAIDDQGTSNSKITMDLRGDEEVLYRDAVRTVSPAQWDELMQRISYNMGYIGKVTNATFARPDETADPFHVVYDYKREKSGDWDNLRILSQLPPLGLPDVDEKDPPLLPIDLATPGTWVAHAVMKLPAGWSAELPDNIHAKSAFATLDKTYKLQDGAIVTDRRLVILQDKVPAAQWREFHQWYKDAGLESDPFIQLTRADAGQPAMPYNSAAAGMVAQAEFLERQQSWEAALRELDHARALNDRQHNLWMNYSTIAAHQGKIKDAIADLRREVELSPEDVLPTQNLAQLLVATGDTPSAIAALKQFLERIPGQESTATYAATLMLSSKDYAGAEVFLRQQVLSNDSNPNLKLYLARALIFNKKPDEAKPLLETVAATSTSPEQLNDSAFLLADNSLDLPLSELAARKALSLLTEASANGETGKPTLTRSNLLIHTWDTYGWILYRENKFDEAAPWLRASWLNGLSSEEGLHLGTVLLKKNESPEAFATFQLALFGRKEANTDATVASLKSSILALEAQGIQAAPAPQSIQEARTYRIPRPEKLPDFWATVEFEVTSAGTKSATYIDEPKAPRSMLAAVKALDLHLAVPSEGNPHLFRRGILSCHSGPTCDLVLDFPGDASRE